MYISTIFFAINFLIKYLIKYSIFLLTLTKMNKISPKKNLISYERLI